MIFSFHEKITSLLRKFFVGKEQSFTFEKVEDENLFISSPEKIHLYIHIPFCKSMCPYCPYNRIRYDKKLVKQYVKYLLKEIKLYRRKYGEIEFSSIYIGGGTPTNLIDEMEVIIKEIKKLFIVLGKIAIETTVSDVNFETSRKLKNYGINLVSLGVQSFYDKHLSFLGRNYKSSEIEPAVKILKSFDFDLINVDLMFALPNQTKKELINNLKKSIKLGVDQITTYPLFTFPYSSIGRYKKLKKVKMPSFFQRKRIYEAIHNYLIKNNFKRVSVWGFSKKNKIKYSSVTRNYYIGFGAGAGSRLKNIFYFNTFSVNEYINLLSKNKLPIAIKMDISKNLDKYYWLYWKLYETEFSIYDLNKIFNNDKKVKLFIKLLKFLNFVKIEKNKIVLTQKGCFWIHLLQNYFILSYINKVWNVCTTTPLPNKINF